MPATIIGSLQGTAKHDLQLALTQNKNSCCLNHQKEMNRLVQSGATRVHHSAKHTTAQKPRQAHVHLRRLPPTLVTPFISELHIKFATEVRRFQW